MDRDAVTLQYPFTFGVSGLQDMNTSPFMTLPKTVSRLVLMSLGALVLSSCTRGEVVSTPSPEVNDPAVVQERSAGNPTAAPQNAVPQPAIANPPVAAGTVSPPSPRTPAPPAPAPVEIAAAPSSAAPKLATDSPDIQVGLAYSEARTRLIQQGWVPVVADEPGPYGVERQLYDQGITEVSACSGTGVGACRFEFNHPERAQLGESSALSVITHGGSRTEVADWELQYPVVPPIAARPSEVPAQFQGLWNASLEQCSNTSSDGRMVIEPNFIRFYESSGPIVEVKTRGDDEVALTVELSGEGSTWTDTDYYQLFDGGSSIVRNGDPRSIRYRCS